MIFTLAEAPRLLVGLAVAAFILVCLLMVLTVLIQRPQGGGLAGAFGSGAGSGQTAFGAKTGDALTVFTIIVFVVYVLGAIGLNILISPAEEGGSAKVTSTTPAEKTTDGATDGTPAPAGSTPATGTPAAPTTPAPAAPGTAPATTPATTPATAPATTPATGNPDAPASTPPAVPPAAPPAAPPATEPPKPSN